MEEGDAITRLKRAAWERSKSKADAAEKEVRQELQAHKDAIRDYLEWGPMTGSDRDLFNGRFSRLLSGEDK